MTDVTTAGVIRIPAAGRDDQGWIPFRVGSGAAGELRAISLSVGDLPHQLEAVALWRHPGGRLDYARPTSSELLYLIEGRVCIEGEQCETVEVEAGDVVIVPQGFEGTWITLEPVTKLSVTLSAVSTVT